MLLPGNLESEQGPTEYSSNREMTGLGLFISSHGFLLHPLLRAPLQVAAPALVVPEPPGSLMGNTVANSRTSGKESGAALKAEVVYSERVFEHSIAQASLQYGGH